MLDCGFCLFGYLVACVCSLVSLCLLVFVYASKYSTSFCVCFSCVGVVIFDAVPTIVRHGGGPGAARAYDIFTAPPRGVKRDGISCRCPSDSSVSADSE